MCVILIRVSEIPRFLLLTLIVVIDLPCNVLLEPFFSQSVMRNLFSFSPLALFLAPDVFAKGEGVLGGGKIPRLLWAMTWWKIGEGIVE